jgi:hypothetical protein
VTVFQLNSKHRIRQGLDYRAFHLNVIFFRHIPST